MESTIAIESNLKKKNQSKEIRLKGGRVLPNSSNKNTAVSDLSKKRNCREKNRAILLRNVMESKSTFDNENVIDKKYLLFSPENEFILHQDICAMCGAVGNGSESCLIACAQCGECYHPFCINIKITKIMFNKGWRCLDCTVCEGCGKKDDEGKLILCDECDISYHIYCISPPLQSVPNGNWKCNLCSSCNKCGRNKEKLLSKNSALECDNLYSQKKNDRSDCNKQIVSEKDSYNNADYTCTHCIDEIKNNCMNSEDSVKNKCTGNDKDEFSRILTIDSTTSSHWIDGVYMSNHGLNFIKSLSTEFKKKRKFRLYNENNCKDDLINTSKLQEQNKVNVYTEENDIYKDGMEWKSSNTEPPNGYIISTNTEGVNILRKKRQRNLKKLGIGGFNVRHRTIKTIEDKTIVNTFVQNVKKRKGARKKLRSKIHETYPVYMREAFFGKNLLESNSTEINIHFYGLPQQSSFDPSKSELLSSSEITMNDRITQAFNYPTNGKTATSTENVKEFLNSPKNNDLKPRTIFQNENSEQLIPITNSPNDSFPKLGIAKDQINIYKEDVIKDDPTKNSSERFIVDKCDKMVQEIEVQNKIVCSVHIGSQKTAEKMRIDEDLGKLATISAVLYANTKHPDLKQIYPNWTDRCKQILKIWRSLPTEYKVPFLQLAKDNRSASRARRSSQDQDKITGSDMCKMEDMQEQLATSSHIDKKMEKGKKLYKKIVSNEEEKNNFKEIKTICDNPKISPNSESQKLKNSKQLQKNIPIQEQNLEGVVPQRRNVLEQSDILSEKDTLMYKDMSLNYTSNVQLKTEKPINKICQGIKETDVDFCKNYTDDGIVDILKNFGEDDEDELLNSLTAELGNDFNILEYGDPELDQFSENKFFTNKVDKRS